jgi:hypothetical protein
MIQIKIFEELSLCRIFVFWGQSPVEKVPYVEVVPSIQYARYSINNGNFLY